MNQRYKDMLASLEPYPNAPYVRTIVHPAGYLFKSVNKGKK